MISKQSLSQAIKKEFSTVQFPLHCGLHAGMAMDNWIEDKEVLREITQRDDYIGDWWNVPTQQLAECMLALSYLDGPAMEFYLPAYMKAIIETPEVFDIPRVRSSSWQVIFTMLPNEENDPELKQHFKNQFSRIKGIKKQVCRKFLKYISYSNEYDNHAIELARKALKNEFWGKK